jgi:hypothetical protein
MMPVLRGCAIGPEVGTGAPAFSAYDITGLPVFLVLDRAGTVIHKQVGFRSPDDVRRIAEIVNDNL